jgi:hypothetical protein
MLWQMLRGLLRVVLVTAVALGLTCGTAEASTVPNHGYFNSNGIYDCQIYAPAVIGSGGYYEYVNSYKFSSNGTYAESGVRVGKQLKPPLSTGHYHLSGNRIIPSSGILKRSGDYMVIEKSSLHVAKDNGHLSDLNCIRIYPPPPAPPKVLPIATYTCDQTYLYSSDGIHMYYTSHVVTSTLTFYNNGTYQPNALSAPGDWHASGSKIVFTSGPYWSGGSAPQHNVGVFHSPGVLMTDAQPGFNTLYSLVIKDTVQEGGDPPYQEFSNNDGPNGSYTGVPESWFYCNKN